MISLTSGRKVAILNEDKKDCVYITEEEDDPELDTTREHKVEIFKKYLHLDNKLSTSDIKELVSAYEKGVEVDGKLNRKYHNAKDYVTESLKRHLDYGTDTNVFPVIEEDSYRIFVSGLSGSGKSHWIAEFLKQHPVKKGSGIFLFSPVEKDKAMDKIKNLIRVNLDDVEKELKKEFTIEDIPEHSVVIFDDCESFPKKVAKRYLELRDIFMERGRHRFTSTITVSHNCCNGHSTKVCIREAQYYALFPSANKRDVKVLLSTYAGLDKKIIDQIMAMKTRCVFFKKTIPQYAIGEHSIIVI